MFQLASWGVKPIVGKFKKNTHFKKNETITVQGADPMVLVADNMIPDDVKTDSLNTDFMQTYFLQPHNQLGNLFSLKI